MAGIERPATWYCATRHTCASHLLMDSWATGKKGWLAEGRAMRLEDVAHRLGHESLEATKRYAHLAKDWSGNQIVR